MAVVNKFNINKQVATLNLDIYDVTSNNDGATFASLSTLLSSKNLSTLIPLAVRRGGMSIRFVQSSDNKYMQYRLMSNTFNTNVVNWQGVDEEPTAGSNNLVKSGGVMNALLNNPYLNYYLCETDGNERVKEVTIPDFDINKVGSYFYIKMLHAHTNSLYAYLNINNQTQNRPILYENCAVSTNNTWCDGEVVKVFYSGDEVYYAQKIDFYYRVESAISSYSDIIGTTLNPVILGYGFYKDNFVIQNHNTWIRGFVDVSNYANKIIKLVSAIRGDARIIITGDNDTILDTVSAPSQVEREFIIDLSLYIGAKRIYFCSEIAYVRHPYAVVDFPTKSVYELNTEVNELSDLIIKSETVSASNPGYINHTGDIVGETSEWTHSDIFSISQFVSAKGFVNHKVVSNIAFYTKPIISSENNNFKGYYATNVPSPTTIIDKETFISNVPDGAKYFVCSTDSSKSTLELNLLENTINELKTSIDDIEEQVKANTEDINNLKKRPQSRDLVVSNKMLHISFDDTINAFYDLVQNSRESIFNSPFFSTLKTLHDTYGVVFSCYCFCDLIDLKYVSKLSTITSPSETSIYYLSAVDESYSIGYYVWVEGRWVSYNESTMRSNYVLFSLSDMPNTYASEFSASKYWLKFGFHSLDSTVTLVNVNASDVKSYYDKFIENIFRITGSVETIDMVPRLQSFSGTLDICRTLRDCDCGCLGFLTADYSETSGGSGGHSDGYYLTSPVPVVLWNKGHWYDYQERLHFYPSSLRLDGLTDVATETYMNKFLTVAKYGQSEMICMYCHENQMFKNGSVGSNYVASLTKVAKWAVENDYLFGYPMNIIKCSI